MPTDVIFRRNWKVHEWYWAAITLQSWSPVHRLVVCNIFLLKGEKSFELELFLLISKCDSLNDLTSQVATTRVWNFQVGGIRSLFLQWPFRPLYTNILPYLPKKWDLNHCLHTLCELCELYIVQIESCHHLSSSGPQRRHLTTRKRNTQWQFSWLILSVSSV